MDPYRRWRRAIYLVGSTWVVLLASSIIVTALTLAAAWLVAMTATQPVTVP
jgi:hypothetical protein